jgi:hypothetical protein
VSILRATEQRARAVADTRDRRAPARREAMPYAGTRSRAGRKVASVGPSQKGPSAKGPSDTALAARSQRRAIASSSLLPEANAVEGQGPRQPGTLPSLDITRALCLLFSGSPPLRGKTAKRLHEASRARPLSARRSRRHGCARRAARTRTASRND